MAPANAPPDDEGTPEEASVRVVRAIAAYANEEPADLPPLADSVDPDALDRLLGSLAEGSVTFVHAGFLVRLAADGDVSVESLESEATWRAE